jgi:hypothetical protein
MPVSEGNKHSLDAMQTLEQLPGVEGTAGKDGHCSALASHAHCTQIEGMLVLQAGPLNPPRAAGRGLGRLPAITS